MGVKALQCFPWYGRRKERKRSKTSQEETPAATTTPPPQAEKPRLHSTNSGGSDTDGHQSGAYFSGKARVSFRHQMDSNMYVNDSTF